MPGAVLLHVFGVRVSFDARMAEFVSPNEVVIYESLVIGASVIGFFVRPILYYRRPHAIDATSDVTGVLLVAALLLLIMAVQVEVVIAGGLVACCALGYCGSTAHAILRGALRERPAWRAPPHFLTPWAFWCRFSTTW